MLMHILLYFVLAPSILCLSLYNHNSATYRNYTWMTNLDDGVPLRQLTILGSHSSMGTGTWGDAFQTQGSSLSVQLASGIRALDIRCRHYQNSFPIHDRLVYLNIDLGGVLNIVQSFLSSNPGQTVLMHIVEEYSPSGNTRTFQQTFKSYKTTYSNLIWQPTTQNPTLGMTRGKVVIIQNFVGAIHGLLYGSFTTIEHKEYSTNWDQHDRWISIKNFISSTSTAGSSRISFWSGNYGSFPYFCASGKSSPGNNDPRLVTGLTTPGFDSYYPDFPRVACVWIFVTVCTIIFQGINTLAYNYINTNNFNYLGIIFADFTGDDMISSFIAKNGNIFGKCSGIQLSQGCTACSTAGVCLSCNSMLHYLFDAPTSTCLAQPGYYLNSTSIPNLCADSMAGCLECSSETTCTLCDTFVNYKLVMGQCQAADGYYLDANQIPIKCNIQGCYLCSSATVCTNCSSATNFVMDGSGNCVCDAAQNFMLSPAGGVCICTSGLFLNANGTCQPIPLCPANNSGCITCVSSVCTLCDTAAGFISDNPYCICEAGLFYDGAICQLCNSTQPACLECITSTLCIQCVANFTLVEGSCTCNPQYYQFDTDTCLECTVGCLQCTGPGSCTRCDTNASFLLIGGVCQCQVGKYVDMATFGEICVPCGAMPGCINCNMNGCIACDSILGFLLAGSVCDCNFGYYVDTVMTVCSQCRLQGCLDCITATQCVVCDNNTHYLDVQTSTCLQICGDGVLFSLQCDDNNTLDGDGCSSMCKIQTYFTCSGGSSLTPSACSYSGQIALNLTSFIKQPNQNKVTIKFIISPNIPLFDQLNYEQTIVPNFPYSSRETVYDSNTGQVSFVFNYDKSLNTNEQMQVSFVPPAQNLQFYYTPTKRLRLPYTTDNNLALKAYSPQVYSLMPVINILGYLLLGLSLATFIFAFFFSSKLMAVEMIFVIQIAYIGLIAIHKLETLLYPLINLWPVNGYNRLGFADKNENSLPPRVSIVGYKHWLITNFNVNIILVILPFLIALIVYIYGRKKQDKQKRLFSYRICKQWGISVALFVQMHLITSLIIAFQYGMDQIYGIVIGILISVLLLVFAALLIAKPKNFGQYKNFFQTKQFRSNFYVFIITVRFIIGVSLPALSSNISGFCVCIAVLFIQLLVLLIYRPYTSNIRPFINCLVTLITLSIYLGYQIRVIDEVQWITTYIPLILILLLIICVIFNLVMMIRHAFCNKDKEQKVKRDQYFQQMEMTMQQQAFKNFQQIQDLSARITPRLLRQGSSPPMKLGRNLLESNSRQELKKGQNIQEYHAI